MTQPAPDAPTLPHPALTRPETVEEYFARIDAATGSDGRLPTFTDDAMSGWEIFPYELDGLTVRHLEGPSDTEPPRRGEDPATCWCARDERRDPIWSNERWLLRAGPSSLPFDATLVPREHYDLPTLPLDLAAEMGTLMTVIGAAVEALPSVGRVHVSKWGDGGAHLHLFFFGRPLRMSQLRGSCLPQWMEHLPVLPPDVAQANIDAVVDGIVRRVGGEAGPRT